MKKLTADANLLPEQRSELSPRPAHPGNVTDTEAAGDPYPGNDTSAEDHYVEARDDMREVVKLLTSVVQELEAADSDMAAIVDDLLTQASRASVALTRAVESPRKKDDAREYVREMEITTPV